MKSGELHIHPTHFPSWDSIILNFKSSLAFLQISPSTKCCVDFADLETDHQHSESLPRKLAIERNDKPSLWCWNVSPQRATKRRFTRFFPYLTNIHVGILIFAAGLELYTNVEQNWIYWVAVCHQSVKLEIAINNYVSLSILLSFHS